MKFKTLLIILLLSMGALQSQSKLPKVKGEIIQNQSYIETYDVNENKATHCIYFPFTEQTCGPNNSTIFGINVLNNSSYIVSKVEIEDRSINAKSTYNITFGDRESRLIQFSDPSYSDLSVGEVKKLRVTLYSNNKIICYREIEIRVTASGRHCDCQEVEADVDPTTLTESGCSDDEGTAIISLSKAISGYKLTLRKIKSSGTKTITGIASTSSIPLTGLSSGIWVYTIEYPNNCKAITGTFSISETKDCCDLKATIKSNIPANCDEGGEVIFSITGGTPNPDYELRAKNTLTNDTRFSTYSYPGSENAEFGNLTPGVWEYNIIDGSGCEVTGSFQISDSQDNCCDLKVTTKLLTPAKCGEGGKAVLAITGGNPNTDYRLEWEHTETNDGYDELFNSPEDAELTDLIPGIWKYELNDGNGCVVTGSFQILDSQEDCCDLQIGILKTTEAGCSGDNGTATISIAGGAPVYTLTFDESPIDVDDIEYFADGTYLIENLASGTYEYTIVDESDSNCVFKDSFNIESAFESCDELKIYHNSLADFDETFYSNADRFITVSLNAENIPDAISVYINDDLAEYWTAGSNTCDDIIVGNPDEGEVIVTAQEEVRTFFIKKCDKVRIEVSKNVPCNISGGSVYTLRVNCGITIDKSNYRPSKWSEELSSSSKNSATAGSLNIFPNPVQHTLNITNYNSGINYETVRIFDKYGKVIITKKISNTSDLKIDTSFLSTGLYLIELIDNTGNKITEKFIKKN